MRAFLTTLEDAVETGAAYAIPELGDAALADARAQALIRRFGQLQRHWPSLLEAAARRNRDRGAVVAA